MPLMQISLNISEKPKRLVKVDPDGTALGAGYTKIGTFNHPDNADPLGAPGSHVLYHHVRDALYKVKDTPAPVGVSFWPDNITDMQTVEISIPPPLEPINFISPDSPTLAVPVSGTAQMIIYYNPEDTSTSKTLTVTSSDTSIATAVFSGDVGPDSKATKVTVTGVALGNATITCTTANGKSTTFTANVN